MTHKRCACGFLVGVISCPSGCHTVTPTRRRWRSSVQYTTEQMIKALESEGSTAGAARHLGVHKGTFYDRAKTEPELAGAMARCANTHPKFIDMTNWSDDEWTVLSRALNASSSAAWCCKHRICGKVSVLVGTQLRSGKVSCRKCRGGR